MNLLPVAYRELVVSARRRGVFWQRFAFCLGVALLSIAVAWIRIRQGAAPDTLGRALFCSLTVYAGVVCLFAGPVLLAESLAAERCQGTLGLLLLTPLRPVDIVLGKLTGMAVPAMQGLLAVLPVLTAGFLIGGTTGEEFARTALALTNLLFVSFALGIVGSAVAPSGPSAFMFTMGVAMVCGGSLVTLTLFPALSAEWAGALLQTVAAPASAVLAAWDSGGSCDVKRFANLVLASHAGGWLGVLVACRSLHGAWREQERPVVATQRGAWPRWGDGELPLNWLARRRLRWAVAPWLFVVACGLIALAFARESEWTGGQVTRVVLLFWILHALFKVAVAWSAVRGLRTERESGALEMLLVTPVGLGPVWQAWLRALRRRFLWPALALVCWETAAFLGWSWWSDTPPSRMIFPLLLVGGVFLLDCYALIWMGIWQGLVARSAASATIRTLMALLLVPVLPCLPWMAQGLQGWSVDPDLWGWSLACLWGALGILASVGFGAWSMVRLSDDLREKLTARV